MSTNLIYVLDEVIVKPGQGQAFLQAYMDKYALGARERGMVLDRVLVSPALWLEDQSNTLHITWALKGPGGFWQMSFLGRRDPTVRGFWDSVAHLVESRSRSFLAPAANIEALCNV